MTSKYIPNKVFSIHYFPLQRCSHITWSYGSCKPHYYRLYLPASQRDHRTLHLADALPELRRLFVQLKLITSLTPIAPTLLLSPHCYQLSAAPSPLLPSQFYICPIIVSMSLYRLNASVTAQIYKYSWQLSLKHHIRIHRKHLALSIRDGGGCSVLGCAFLKRSEDLNSLTTVLRPLWDN